MLKFLWLLVLQKAALLSMLRLLTMLFFFPLLHFVRFFLCASVRFSVHQEHRVKRTGVFFFFLVVWPVVTFSLYIFYMIPASLTSAPSLLHSVSYIDIYIYIYVQMYTYLYIYIYRYERKKKNYLIIAVSVFSSLLCFLLVFLFYFFFSHALHILFFSSLRFTSQLFFFKCVVV